MRYARRVVSVPLIRRHNLREYACRHREELVEGIEHLRPMMETNGFEFSLGETGIGSGGTFAGVSSSAMTVSSPSAFAMAWDWSSTRLASRALPRGLSALLGCLG